ncbi:hypothetical protein FDUTEX481_07499 [Tolypothrix sp. PCC 7601]|nr:hypothetical protein FDUTEX481_07499 [Tolypothrix sp. PCC 7601]
MKPALLQGFALTHQERGARDLVPLLPGEKGLGDEGTRYL